MANIKLECIKSSCIYVSVSISLSLYLSLYLPTYLSKYLSSLSLLYMSLSPIQIYPYVLLPVDRNFIHCHLIHFPAP